MFNLGNSVKNLLVSKEEENKYYDETIQIDINDTNNTHSIIAKEIENGSTCLDIGCGAGYTADLLKDKECEIYGIEIDTEAIRTAKNKKIYKEIYTFSITDSKTPEFQDFFNNKIKFDYIILADVLEHLEKPGEVIYNLSKKLKKNGKFLISIPNIAHMDICKNLINRTFNYNKIGILDNTHLRFFTKSSFYDMMDSINDIYNTNFQVSLIGKTIIPSPEIDMYPNFCEILNQDKEFHVLQYVYKIEKLQENQLKKRNKDKRKTIDYCAIIEEKLREYKECQEILKAQNKELENITQEQKRLQGEKQKAEEELVRLNEIIAIQNQRYKELIESNSWKLTKPLRKLMDILRKMKRR